MKPLQITIEHRGKLYYVRIHDPNTGNTAKGSGESQYKTVQSVKQALRG